MASPSVAPVGDVAKRSRGHQCELTGLEKPSSGQLRGNLKGASMENLPAAIESQDCHRGTHEEPGKLPPLLSKSLVI